MTTGEKIRVARKRIGFTQKQLGNACGIAEPTIRRYELGKLNPKMSTLIRIALPLKVSPESLIGDETISKLTSAISGLDKNDDMNVYKILSKEFTVKTALLAYKAIIDTLLERPELPADLKKEVRRLLPDYNDAINAFSSIRNNPSLVEKANDYSKMFDKLSTSDKYALEEFICKLSEKSNDSSRGNN